MSEDIAGRELFDLLCKMAGVDRLTVRSIECRCAVKEVVKFNVELLAETERMKTVLGKALAVNDG